MYLYVDAGHVPPTIELREADDFTSLRVVVVTDDHVWLDPAALAELAGRTGDPAWEDQLTRMVGYADRMGWLDEHGRIRAHVDVQST